MPLIRMLQRWRAAAFIALCLSFNACQTQQTAPAPAAPLPLLGQASFGEYRDQISAWLRTHRRFASADHEQEIAWNAPKEWRPATTPVKGIVLFHGLGDSPWSFADIGRSLASQGFLVRAVLLAGHGTKPADLVAAHAGDWQRLVREQVALLKKDVPEVYLGGFSTGANLVLDYAIDDASIRGLLLFSPAIKASMPFEWMAPLLARARPWLHAPDDDGPQQSPVRYLNIPTNGFAQFHETAAAVRAALARKAFDRPALIVSAEHDSVVDVDYMLRTFESRFTNKDSRMIWYGKLPPDSHPGARVLVRPDRLPAQRISEFSHMGVLFSPANPLYGSAGSQRFCYNGQGQGDTARCEAGAQVWYSDWGYKEEGKIHARLTFNPYYAWQAEVMHAVVAAQSGG